MAGGVGGGYEIERSLRFNSADSAYLNRTPSSAGNRKTWTWSGWLKNSAPLTGTQSFFAAGSNGFTFRISATGAIETYEYSGGFVFHYVTSALFRDPSAWYHIVLAVNTDDSTASDRIKIYVNGSRITDFVTSTSPSSGATAQVNNTVQHEIGNSSTNTYLNGYLADIHFIDGQALAPTDFGETDDNGVWQPKKYSGSYGTNGFHLDFKDNSSNAALGNDAAGSNNWTVNNLTAVNAKESANWLAMATGTPFNSSHLLSYAFDGNSNTQAAAGQGNTMSFTPSPAITGISKIRIKARRDNGVTNAGLFTLNGTAIGGSWSENSTATVEITALGGSAITQLTNLSWSCNPNNNNWFGVYTIEIYYGGSYKTLVTNTTVAASIDSLVDTPNNAAEPTDTGAGGEVVGNYCTWNALDQKDYTLTNGNLDASSNAGAWRSCRGTIGMSSGKWYWEVTSTNDTAKMIGIATSLAPVDNWAASSAYGWIYNKNGYKYHNGGYSGYGASYTTGDVIGVAFDADNGSLAFYKNGASQGTAYTGLTSGPYFPVTSLESASSVSANFGARAFAYPLSGYKSLNTANLPEPTIADGSKYFDTVLWSGDGSGAITVPGLSLNNAPGFVWSKTRNHGYHNNLWDAVRGFGSVNALVTDGTYAEGAANGGTLNSATSSSLTFSGGVWHNENNKTYAAWAWDSGTSTVSNTDGSITSQVRANPSAGFSIVKATIGSGSVGHGLNAVPSFVITKTLGSGIWWTQGHVYSNPAANYQRLNTTVAVGTDTSAFNNTAATSTTFNFNSNYLYGSSQECISYCFAPVEGYSAMGSYVGTNSADGPFVFTGFKPAFVLLKNISSAGTYWTIHDNKRLGYNPDQDLLFANTSDAENATSYMDFLSNGFKLRINSSFANASGSTFIYLALAEHPFKTARAR